MEKLKKICLSKMNTEDNFKNLCDLTTSLVGLPKGSLALKTRKTEYQVPRMVAAMVARLEDETHREVIAKVLDRNRTSVNHYERCHSANYSSFPLYRNTFNKVYNAQRVTGLRLSPDDAYLITRGLRTLDVRLDKHRDNAKKVSEFLSKFKNIKLLYPYKKDSFNFRMWKKYYSGASGLMGLRIKSKSKNSVVKFVNSLKLFGHGYSWGGFESLALHQNVREQGLRSYLKLADNEYIVRLHIGLEDPDDLIADIKQALKHLK